jgi:ParB family chromosome partitioning protein
MNSKKNKGLGKGLSALFGEQKSQENQGKSGHNIRKALVGEISRNSFQPRTIFDESKLDELAMSIKKNGIIQPIAVRKSKSAKEPYEIVAGERRWLAAQKAGLHEVPIVIMDLNDSETLEVAIVENIQREDLNVIEEAKGYKRLNEEFGYDQDKIAKFKICFTGMPNASSIAEEIVAKKLSARSIENIKKKKTKPLINDPNIFDAQRDIERSIGLNVNIQNKKNNSGKLIIEYKNLDQLEMVSKLLKKR